MQRQMWDTRRDILAIMDSMSTVQVVLAAYTVEPLSAVTWVTRSPSVGWSAGEVPNEFALICV